METIDVVELIKELDYGRLVDEGALPELFKDREKKSVQPTGFSRDFSSEEKLAIYKASAETAVWNELSTTHRIYNQSEGSTLKLKEVKGISETLETLILLKQIIECRFEMNDSGILKKSSKLQSATAQRVLIRARPDAVGWRVIYALCLTKKMVGQEYNKACLRLFLTEFLASENDDYLSEVCLISPLHGAYRCNSSDLSWDRKKFIEIISHAVRRILFRRCRSALEVAKDLVKLRETCIGMTVRKRKIVETFKEITPLGKPFQVFVTARLGNKLKKITTSDSEIEKCSAVLESSEATMFIHAPYVIRLGNEGDPSLALLVNDLSVATRMGASGVVVHTASNTRGLAIGEAEDEMYRVVKTHLKYATEKCPILLETPAKEGSELVTDVQSFVRFYRKFTAEERKRVKLCVDTCHVFSAGYYPLEYLQEVYKALGDIVGLVHFNGSAVGLHGCNDLHAWSWYTDALREILDSTGWVTKKVVVDALPVWMRDQLEPNCGHPVPKKGVRVNLLPLHDLLAAAEWCSNHNIPMVTE